MIKIFYCNDDKNEEVAKRKAIAEKHNSYLPFSDLFYRHISDENITFRPIDFKIFANDKDEETYYDNEFKELLQYVFELYTNNSKIRKMTIGDIIEIKTRVIDLRFIVIQNGFKLI